MANIFDLFKKIEQGGGTAPSGPVSHLIVGLGNPGAQYAGTRHNAGFMALDAMAEKMGTRIDRAKFKALVGEGMLGGARVLLMKPQTFMNLSGEAVGEAASFYRIAPENVIVIYDDVTLPVGRLRVRAKGSDGGHNGMKSIIAHLGGNTFPRIRLGVGEKPSPEYDLADWVLSAFSAEDKNALAATFQNVYAGAERIIAKDMEGAMRLCNGK